MQPAEGGHSAAIGLHAARGELAMGIALRQAGVALDGEKVRSQILGAGRRKGPVVQGVTPLAAPSNPVLLLRRIWK